MQGVQGHSFPFSHVSLSAVRDHLGMSVFFQTSLFYKAKEMRNMKKNQKCDNFSSDITEKKKSLRPCMFGKRNTRSDIFMKCCT